MKSGDLREYLELIEKFRGGSISASAFEQRYLALFKGEERNFSDAVYEVLQRLFSDVDMFVVDAEMRLETELGEEELLISAARAYDELLTLLD